MQSNNTGLYFHVYYSDRIKGKESRTKGNLHVHLYFFSNHVDALFAYTMVMPEKIKIHVYRKKIF